MPSQGNACVMQGWDSGGKRLHGMDGCTAQAVKNKSPKKIRRQKTWYKFFLPILIIKHLFVGTLSDLVQFHGNSGL